MNNAKFEDKIRTRFLALFVNNYEIFLGRLKRIHFDITRDHKPETNKKSIKPYPFDREAKGVEIAIPLKQTFRFIHEPVERDQSEDFIGRKAELDAFVERVIFSNGGSFLVTGYRGVGKSSFVNQALSYLNKALPWASQFLGNIELLDIYLNLARPVEPAELMHHIIRSLYDRLIEIGIFSQLQGSLQEEIKLAYMRTSFNMSRKIAEASEKNYGLGEVGISNSQSGAVATGLFTIKKSISRENEISFLGYDDKAAEHDIIRISHQLTTNNIISQSFWQRLQIRIRRQPMPQRKLKIIFVFDELDKLEEFKNKDKDDKKPAFDEILAVLKTLFTTSGITFIFVAGSSLQEKWIEETGRGDSIYESVFSYDKYLSCMWNETDQFCDNLVDKDRLAQEVNDPIYCERCGTKLSSINSLEHDEFGTKSNENSSNNTNDHMVILPLETMYEELGIRKPEQIPGGSTEELLLAKIKEDPRTPNSYCPNCLSSITEEIAFCENCGFCLYEWKSQPLSSDCTLCGSHLENPLDQNTRFCPNCGGQITHNWPYCIHCDHQLVDLRLSRQMLETLKKYLKYTGRGIPRRIIRSINKLVRWDAKQPFIGLTVHEGRRIRFYSALQELIDRELLKVLKFRVDDIYGNIQDNNFLAIYYLFDWIFSRGSQSFTYTDMINAFTNLNIRSFYLKNRTSDIVQAITQVLLENEYIQIVPFLGKVQMADNVLSSTVVYRVAERRLVEIGILDQEEKQAEGETEDRLINTRIARFIVIKYLAEGGMGRIYQALDTANNRNVVLKIVDINNSQPSYLNVLENESIVLSYLSHPNIVKFLDYGIDNGQTYLAIEFIEGISLLDLLNEKRKIEFITAWSIFQPIAKALSYIHEKGILHGDIKPGNIMIDTSGAVHLTDFGLSKDFRGSDLSGKLRKIHAGTPPYSPPEYFIEGETDQRSDIYAFAATIYQTLTGHMTYTGNSWNEIYQQQIQHSPQSPSSYCTIPVEVESIILHCLEANPDNRPQTIEEVMNIISEGAVNLSESTENLRDIVFSIRNSIEVREVFESRQTEAKKSDYTYVARETIRPTGDQISLHPFFNFEENVDTQDTPTETMISSTPHLILLKGPSTGKNVYTLDPLTTIGRSSENVIELLDDDTSRYHAEIRKDDFGYWINDLNSINGTLVNGKHILDKVLLKDDDQITIGKYVFECGGLS